MTARTDVKKLPTLSVIIPNYNHGECLPTCLRALLSQSVPATEIIVIDDGSTDNSLEVIQEFAREHPTIRWYQNDVNRGVNFTCNRGLELATGDFVFVPAADDEVLPGLFEKCLNLLAEHPQAGLCATVVEMCDMATGATWYLGSKVADRYCYLSPTELVQIARQDKLQIFTSGMIVHRESFLQAGKYLADLRWHSDWFVLFVIGFRKGLCFVPEALSQFRIYAASFSNKGRRQTSEQLKVLRAILSRLDEPGYQDVVPYIRDGALLAPFGKEMLWLLITDRRHWHFLTPAYLRNALFWTARVEARKIMPARLADWCLQVAGWKKLPKGKTPKMTVPTSTPSK
jgi:glycosyltransferase involved in cell wall biosynthesis